MKNIGMAHTAMLSLLLAATATLGFAQQDNKGKGQDRQDKQAQPSGGQQGQQQQHAQPNSQQGRGQQQQREQTRPDARSEHGQAQRPQQQQQQRQQQQQHVQQQQGMQPEQQRNSWQQHRASNFDSQHQSWAQRGGYQGYRVPDANFRRSFGAGHSFHVYGLPFMEIGGRPRFQYGGYWFSMMEPYPEYWGANWYQNDDMYVDYYGGGYYLYDRRFPGRPGVAISISF